MEEAPIEEDVGAEEGAVPIENDAAVGGLTRHRSQRHRMPGSHLIYKHGFVTSGGFQIRVDEVSGTGPGRMARQIIS